MNQAVGYAEDFKHSDLLDGNPSIRAFVVGDKIDSKTSREHTVGDFGKVYATTYGQITRSAHQRLFKLKEKIPAHFEGVSGSELVKKVMATPSQAGLLP